MHKVLVILLGLLALPFGFQAADRVVVVEIFTGTWCPYCPGASMGADDLVEAHPGKVLVVEYHSGDIFENIVGSGREAFYTSSVVRGYPTAIFDGADTVIGGFNNKSMFQYYNPIWMSRTATDPTLNVTLENTPDAYLAGGTLSATIENTSGGAITGNVIFTITESNIPYKWQTQQFLHFVERDLPLNAEIALAAGADTTITKDYELDPSWPEYTNDLGNIEFGCFVQSTEGEGNLREIFQAGMVQLINPIKEGIDEEPLPAFELKAPAIINGNGYVELSINVPSRVAVAMYDASGRIVKEFYNGNLTSGSHRVEFETSDLSNGAYFIKASCGSFTKVDKLLIIR